MNNELPDIQKTKSNIEKEIKEVGVEGIKLPFMLESKNNSFHDMLAKVSIRVGLDKDTKGISMSRLLLTLKEFLSKPLKHFLIEEILKKLQENLESNSSFINFQFQLPRNRKSPLSDNEFPLFYNSKFEGRLKNGIFRFFQGVEVQYSSHCPCSTELSKDLMNKGFEMGFPHAQRSFAKILVEVPPMRYLWLEEIIEMVESVIKTIPYPIVKRIDEQEIAKIASQNPIFVEDAIRLISDKLDKCEKIHDWIIKCIHEESIHTSEAIAINWKGIEGGFDGRYYL